MKLLVTFCLCLPIQILTWQIYNKMNLLNQLMLLLRTGVSLTYSGVVESLRLCWQRWQAHFSESYFGWCLRPPSCFSERTSKVSGVSNASAGLASVHMSKSSVYTPFTPCWKPGPLTLTPLSHSTPWLFSRDYKCQVEDHNFLPLLWMNYRILKLLDVEICDTASRCRLDPSLP